MTRCLLSMPGNENTAAAMGQLLECETADIALHRFPDGESSLRVAVELSGKDIAIVCTLDHPDEKLAALLLAAELARDLGATSVGLVAPYLAYMRQDMRFHPGESVTAQYFAKLICRSFDWLLTVDPHLHRITTLASIYTIPTMVVPAAPAIGAWIREHVKKPGLIGPDAESRQWVADVARHAHAPFIVLDKVRGGDHLVAVSVPDCTWLPGYTPVIIDDIVSTAGTLIAAIRTLGTKYDFKPVCIVVHALFAGDSFARLKNAGASTVLSCNTVLHESNAIAVNRELANAANQLLNAIYMRRHRDGSH